MSISIVALVAALNATLPILPADVEQECEDHVAAYRIVQGHELVFSCESWEWFHGEQYDEAEEASIAQGARGAGVMRAD